jgi:2-oxoglutarate ferredoxin oxidoreductase subunit beta
VLRLHKLAADYDPTDRVSAMNYLARQHASGEVVTGLLFVEPDHGDLHHFLNTVDVPLNGLGETELCPGQDVLTKYNAAHR